MSKYYAVFNGRTPGIYNSWADCEAQTKGFPNSKFKSFKTFEEASEAYNQNNCGIISHIPIMDSYCVDGACSGNPGPIEYRCVHTESGEVMFHQGFEGYGTNNISEFLALVHALALFKQHGINQPIYSDSIIAMTWVKQKRCNTNLKDDYTNTNLLRAVKGAERWLNENAYQNEILKWETHLWGEIPADFGRK